jgi:hypothetical protein
MELAANLIENQSTGSARGKMTPPYSPRGCETARLQNPRADISHPDFRIEHRPPLHSLTR